MSIFAIGDKMRHSRAIISPHKPAFPRKPDTTSVSLSPRTLSDNIHIVSRVELGENGTVSCIRRGAHEKHPDKNGNSREDDFHNFLLFKNSKINLAQVYHIQYICQIPSCTWYDTGMATFEDKNIDNKLHAIREDEAEDVTSILAEKYGFEYINLASKAINPEALRTISLEESQATQVIPFELQGNTLFVGIVQPTNTGSEHLLQSLQEKGYVLRKYLISKKSFDSAFDRYKELSLAKTQEQGSFDISPKKIAEEREKIVSVELFRKKIESLEEGDRSRKVTHFLEILFAGATQLSASDIHIEPEEEHVRIRARIDGILVDITSIDIPTYRLLLARIKLLSGMKINIHARAQDGRFSIHIGDDEVEVRSSVIPGAYGESIVMRILDPHQGALTIEELGMREELASRLLHEISKPNGLILNTGPTGSGKTTTLYSFLSHVSKPGIKIITLENPVEYKLPGIVQTQVDDKTYTFAKGLRSILRQDPDIIMVGEIRDTEVAQTAIQAALTGHLVFSTLHTNSAAGAFPRLIDLGVDPKSFASGINVVIAQRLVRKLKQETRIARPITDTEKELIQKVLTALPEHIERPAIPDTLFAPQVTETDTGYHGRIGVFEAVFMDDELGELLRSAPSESDIKKIARAQGNLTMLEDGILKVLDGITTIEEVQRVVEL